jgi:predicted amidohydrolase
VIDFALPRFTHYYDADSNITSQSRRRCRHRIVQAVSGQATLALNSKRCAATAAAAAAQGAQIIVFPEYGLSGFGTGRDAWIQYLEQLPDPSQGVVPCDKPVLFVRAPSLVTLSCAAKRHGIAIVANIGDLVYCNETRPHPGCKRVRDGRLQFNTAVAFDTDGSYLAKAYKQNLWGEAVHFDTPQKCPDVSFRTSFGVTFGLFTCADVIFRHPAQRMVAHAVQHFVVGVPTAGLCFASHRMDAGCEHGYAAMVLLSPCYCHKQHLFGP